MSQWDDDVRQYLQYSDNTSLDEDSFSSMAIVDDNEPIATPRAQDTHRSRKKAKRSKPIYLRPIFVLAAFVALGYFCAALTMVIVQSHVLVRRNNVYAVSISYGISLLFAFYPIISYVRRTLSVGPLPWHKRSPRALIARLHEQRESEHAMAIVNFVTLAVWLVWTPIYGTALANGKCELLHGWAKALYVLPNMIFVGALVLVQLFHMLMSWRHGRKICKLVKQAEGQSPATTPRLSRRQQAPTAPAMARGTRRRGGGSAAKRPNSMRMQSLRAPRYPLVNDDADLSASGQPPLAPLDHSMSHF